MAAAAIGSTILQGVLALQQGRAAAQAANIERRQVEEQRALAQIEAMEEERGRREALNRALAAQRAQAAAAGIDISRSASFNTLQRADRHAAERGIQQARLSARAQDRNFKLTSRGLRLKASSAMTAGRIGFGASLFKAAGQFSDLQTPPAGG